MSRAVAASQMGLDYQARFFWCEAAVRLLDEASPISRVGFEVPDVGGFDDVVAERTTPDRDEFGRSITRDCFQVKFHVDAVGALTAEGLCDPREIGGTSRSFLQRAKSAYTRLGSEIGRTRLHLVTTHPIDSNDPLSKLYSSNEGGLRMQVLGQGGCRSKMGKLRARWCEHLELEREDELIEVLRPLRFWHSAPNYARLQVALESKLSHVGLLVPTGDGAQNPYEQLIWRLNREQSYYFEPETLRTECDRAKLTAGAHTPKPERGRAQVAVRSFKRPAIDLADTADELLSLLEYFDGRFLRTECSWRTVHEQLEPFFLAVSAKKRNFDLQLDTHASLAFASGALLEAKLGLDLNLLQFGRGRMEPWSTSMASSSPPANLSPEDVGIDTGPDVAIALGITHDIIEEVRQHIVDARLPIGRILAIRPVGGSGQAAVESDQHALAIADEVARLIKQRTADERRGELHFFAAAPNALIFFLGQLSRSFGPLILYEYDFEQTRSGGYEPSFSLPIPPTP